MATGRADDVCVYNLEVILSHSLKKKKWSHKDFHFETWQTKPSILKITKMLEKI